MSEQNTVNYDKSLAQENAALKSENAILKEQLALMQEQFEWLMSGQAIAPSIRKVKPKKVL